MGEHRRRPAAAHAAHLDDDRPPLPPAQLLRAAELTAVSNVSHLLSSYATVTLADSLRRWIDIAHAQHRRLRVDELNSVACRGKAGVSDTFASALWATDALFSLARAGVDGVDMHTLPDAAYELFAFSRRDGRWQAQVRPVYYGLQLFAQAAPAGARLLAVSRHGADGGLSVWATRAPDHRLRVVVINKSQTKRKTVSLRLPAGSGATATVERMLAPSAHAKRGVTLGGRTYGAATPTGRTRHSRRGAGPHQRWAGHAVDAARERGAGHGRLIAHRGRRR